MPFSKISLFLLVALFLTGCAASGGPVVQEVKQDASALSDLDTQEKQELESILQTKKPPLSGGDPELQNALSTSRQMEVRDYLQLKDQQGVLGREYRVGPNDVLNVFVYNEEDLSREAMPVNQDGNISLPLLGRLSVEGLTTGEIESLIEQRLKNGGYLLKPQVTVSVQEYNSQKVLVLGAVDQPGRYTLQASEQMLEILSKAGGVDFEAAGHRAVVIRNENLAGQDTKVAIAIDMDRLMKGYDPFANLQLQDGDVIVIPEAEKIYVMGQVEKPGEYVIRKKGLTAVEAIGMAGGFTRIAAPNRVKLVRNDDGGEKVMILRLEEIMEKGQTDITLTGNDVIIVPESYF